MKLLVLIASVAAVVYGQDNSNCKPGVEKFCKGKKFPATACNFTGKSKYNNGDHRSDPKFKQSMIDRHNYYRSQPFEGYGTGADMMEVQWDDELEMNAWIWANELAELNQGKQEGYLEHDDCRVTPSYNPVGQNAAFRGGLDWSVPINVDEMSLANWFNEYKNIEDTSILKKFPNSKKRKTLKGIIGHYTQLVWAKSYKIGCAYVKSETKNYGTQGWVICDYAPAGNVLERSVFTPGPLGSKCLDGSESGGANGLCKIKDEKTFRRSVKLRKPS